MPVTYTNRKGVTYTLCRTTTKTGKPRYAFAREPKGESVEQIPIDDWIYVGTMGPVDRLARQWIPRLGTDALFEVW